MKKRISLSLFVLTVLVTALIAGGCNLNNPVIDDWWIGEEGTPKTSSGVIPKKRFTIKFHMTETNEEYFDANYPYNQPSIKDQIVSEGEASVSEPGLTVIDAVGNDNKHDTPATMFFQGWYTDPVGGTKWDFDTTIVTADKADTDGVIHLYSRWIGSGHTVTFNPGGDFDKNGTIAVNGTDDEIDWSDTIYTPEPEYVAPNTELSQPKGFGLAPTDPLAAYYSFTGWYIDNNNNGIVDSGDTKWDFTQTVTDDMTLYAGWGTKTPDGEVIPPENGGTPTPVYTVIFEDNDPDSTTNLVPNEEVITGNKVTRPDAIYNGTDAFAGWYTDTSFTPANKWDFNTIINNDDYDMADGNDDNTFTLYADWDNTEYTVSFDVQGGDYIDLITDPDNDIHNDEPPDQRVITTAEPKIYEPGLVENPTKYFSGWYVDDNDSGDVDPGDTKWDFDITEVTADKVDPGTTDEITLYAGWSDTGFTVNFDSNGDFDHNGSITSSEIGFGKTVYEPKPEYVAQDTKLSQPKGFGLDPLTAGDLVNKYAFTGWYTDAACTTKWNFNTPVTGDMTLYAGWGTKTPGGVIPPEEGGTPVPVYTVKFNGNGAPNPLSETVAAGGKLASPSAITKSGYSFIGWYKDKALSVLWDFNTEIVDETDDTYKRGDGGADDNSFTLYANWDPEPYTDEWFDKYYVRANPTGQTYFSFQCDNDGLDYGVDVADHLTADPNDKADTTDLDVNFNNEITIINLLSRNPTYIARIIGYKDDASDPDSLVTDREDQTWLNLYYTESGIEPEQLIRNSKLPSGETKSNDLMIIGPNDDYDIIGVDATSDGIPEGDGDNDPDENDDDDEIRVIVYIPM